MVHIVFTLLEILSGNPVCSASLFCKLGIICAESGKTVLGAYTTCCKLSIDILYVPKRLLCCLKQFGEVRLFAGKSLCDQFACCCTCKLCSWNLTKLFFVVKLHIFRFPGTYCLFLDSLYNCWNKLLNLTCLLEVHCLPCLLVFITATCVL